MYSKQRAVLPYPTSSEFDKFTEGIKGENFFFDKGFFVGGQFDFSKLTIRAQETKNYIGYVGNPDYIDNGWANLAFCKDGEKNSLHTIFDKIIESIELHKESISSKLLLVNIHHNNFKRAKEDQIKVSLVKNVLTSLKVVMTIDEWKIFLSSNKEFKIMSDTPWYLTSTTKGNSMVLIRKKEGKIDTKFVPILQEEFNCDVVICIRQSHLKHQN